jgi:hypothetical protein
MVVQRAEGQPPRSEDFFQVESVGSHPSGLIITGVFERNRRQNLRPMDIRRATESEIAALNVLQSVDKNQGEAGQFSSEQVK